FTGSRITRLISFRPSTISDVPEQVPTLIFKRYGDHRVLHSFPTRRSSDLVKHSVVLLKLKVNLSVNQVDVDSTVMFGLNLNQTKKVQDLNLKTKSLVG